MSWFLYVLRCADDTLYTGVTINLERRVDEHNSSPKGARYTRARRPVELVAAWSFDGQSAACKAEYAFKQLRRSAKLRVIEGDAPATAIDVGLGDRIR